MKVKWHQKRQMIAAYEPEDLSGTIEEGLRIKGVRIKEQAYPILPNPLILIIPYPIILIAAYPIIPNPMLKLVAKAMEEMIRK
jgi:hypothetical protein